jgi:hypothetical protein
MTNSKFSQDKLFLQKYRETNLLFFVIIFSASFSETSLKIIFFFYFTVRCIVTYVLLHIVHIIIFRNIEKQIYFFRHHFFCLLFKNFLENYFFFYFTVRCIVTYVLLHIVHIIIFKSFPSNIQKKEKRKEKHIIENKRKT